MARKSNLAATLSSLVSGMLKWTVAWQSPINIDAFQKMLVSIQAASALIMDAGNSLAKWMPTVQCQGIVYWT